MRPIALAAVAMSIALPIAVLAKLPPLSDDANAKAAEATAKTAHGDKVAAYKLCQSMDKVAAKYIADAKKGGKDVAPTASTPCADPGAFAFTPAAPATKPIEAAGAHSPPETATKPPSTTAPAAATTPTPKQ